MPIVQLYPSSQNIISTNKIRGSSSGSSYDDIIFTLAGKRVDVSSGHLNYDYDDIGILMDDSCDFLVNHSLSASYQILHGVDLKSVFNYHLHWFQTQNATPNFLIDVRWTDNGDPVGTFINSAYNSTVFPYDGSGKMLNVTTFPEINHTLKGLSGFVDIHIYRDTPNTSGLFSGADPYVGNVLIKGADIHAKFNKFGSFYQWLDWM